jgi:5-methyltetrahydrofolate--homocysteine methyltransferase
MRQEEHFRSNCRELSNFDFTYSLLSVGFNCALGADQLKLYLKKLSRPCLTAHPNAGLPNAFGEYDETQSKCRCLLKSVVDDDLINIIGGCCGTTPGIKLLRMCKGLQTQRC